MSNEVFTASARTPVSPEVVNGGSKSEVVPGLREVSSPPGE